MAIKERKLGISVVEAAKRRIKSAFSNGVNVYLVTSGGKDSIVICDLVYKLCESGEVDKSLLTVQFCDEEVIYDDVVRVCELWRKKFRMLGVAYEWYCIEHRNNNCFNSLENNENFIPLDRFERANWARRMPAYAIASNKFHVPRTESYQQFFERNDADGIRLCGVRAAESHNRRNYLSVVNKMEGHMTIGGTAYPIYDWKDSDVWKYIKDENIDFPDVYLRMYEAGLAKNQLRVCNFMAIDTVRSLTAMAEVYPDLWERVLKREPNAYLVRLYWDTEMFGRSTERRKKLEEETAPSDEAEYRRKVMDIFKNPSKYFTNPHTANTVRQYRTEVVLKLSNCLEYTPGIWKKMYEAILSGDTKGRRNRAMFSALTSNYAEEERKGRGNEKPSSAD